MSRSGFHWFESSEALRAASEASGQEISEIGLKGFSLLKRNSKTGEYVCDLYVLKMTGAQVDGDRITTFGHEVLHCFGLRHEWRRVELLAWPARRSSPDPWVRSITSAANVLVSGTDR